MRLWVMCDWKSGKTLDRRKICDHSPCNPVTPSKNNISAPSCEIFSDTYSPWHSTMVFSVTIDIPSGHINTRFVVRAFTGKGPTKPMMQFGDPRWTCILSNLLMRCSFNITMGMTCKAGSGGPSKNITNKSILHCLPQNFPMHGKHFRGLNPNSAANYKPKSMSRMCMYPSTREKGDFPKPK